MAARLSSICKSRDCPLASTRFQSKTRKVVSLACWLVCGISNTLSGVGSKGEHPRIPETDLSDAARDFLLATFKLEDDQRPTAEELKSHPFIAAAGVHIFVRCLMSDFLRREQW